VVALVSIWTTLILSTFLADKVKNFGRWAAPAIAPSYVFLTSNDSSYITGPVIRPNGGIIVES